MPSDLRRAEFGETHLSITGLVDRLISSFGKTALSIRTYRSKIEWRKLIEQQGQSGLSGLAVLKHCQWCKRRVPYCATP